MCTASLQKNIMKIGLSGTDNKFADGPVKPIGATDVPLGDGLAGDARVSIMDRRQRIEDALNQAQQ